MTTDQVVLSDPTGATVFPRAPLASAEVGCAGLPQPSPNPGSAPPAYLDLRSEVRLSNPSTELIMIGGSTGNNGILFYGFAPTNLPLGTGNLCVTGTLARAAFGSATGGQTTILLDHGTSPVASGPSAITPGTPVHFQYWFRVPGGSHTTNSLVVTYCP
ncbi:MAG: hypothetical protein AAGG01_10335 [Planctomycetota bacterium]